MQAGADARGSFFTPHFVLFVLLELMRVKLERGYFFGEFVTFPSYYIVNVCKANFIAVLVNLFEQLALTRTTVPKYVPSTIIFLTFS